jgi:hypothetical protein
VEEIGMKDQSKRKYLILSVVVTIALYIVGHALIAIHEIAHGATAVALGGYYPFVQIDAEGGRSLYFMPPNSAAWREAMVLLAGAFSNFLVALIALALIAAAPMRWKTKLFVAFVGGLSALLLVTGAGLLPPWWVKYKETGDALELLRLPRIYQVFIKSLWLTSGVAMFAGLFRLFYKEICRFFPNESYRDRLLIATSTFAVPVLVIASVLSVVMLNSGFTEGVINPKRHYPHLIFLVLTYFLLPLVIPSDRHRQEKEAFIFPRRQFVTLAAVAVGFAITQPIVFGNSRKQPRGLFLSRPPEVSVQACNVSITLYEGYKANVRFSMRPYPAEHGFMWKRIRDLEPEDWNIYEQFVRDNLPQLLPALSKQQGFRVVNRYSDPSARFFNGGWDAGARVIDVQVDSLELPFNKGKDKEVRVLSIVDFWRSRRIGYIDHAELKLEGSLQVTGLATQPKGSGSPASRQSNYLEWQNTLDNHFLVSHVGIK